MKKAVRNHSIIFINGNTQAIENHNHQHSEGLGIKENKDN